MNKHRNTISFVAILTLWTGLLIGTGTLFSGYHLMDDHTILETLEQFDEIGFRSTLKAQIIDDLKIRFRPVYFLHRIPVNYILRDNLLMWSVYIGLLAILTNFFLYRAFVNFKMKHLEALIVSFLALFGYQSVIWFYLGPAETIGMLLLSLCILSFGHFAISKNYLRLYVAAFLCILASLCKESFLVGIPGILLLAGFILWKRNHVFSIKEKVIAGFLFCIFLFGILFIITQIGTEPIGYAGVNASLISISSVQGIAKNIVKEKTNLLIFFGVILLFQSWRFKFQKIHKLDFLVILLSYILLIVTQYVLYFKSGFRAWYLNPLYAYYALFIGLLIFSIKGHTYKNIYLISIVIFLILRISMNFTINATGFAQDGEMLKIHIKNITNNSEPSESIIILCNINHDYEGASSLATYLRHNYEYKDIKYFVFLEESDKSVFTLGLYKNFVAKNKDVIIKASEIQNYRLAASLSGPYIDIFNGMNEQVKAIKSSNNYFVYLFKKS